jgi:hypothetical protein
MEAWNTQASKDEGVDAVAVSKDPVFNGECIIQAKRYSKLVGVAHEPTAPDQQRPAHQDPRQEPRVRRHLWAKGLDQVWPHRSRAAVQQHSVCIMRHGD